MKNIKQLREELTKVFESLRDGKIEPKVASEMNNSAGKIINTVKVQLEYSSMLSSKKKIEFLED